MGTIGQANITLNSHRSSEKQFTTSAQSNHKSSSSQLRGGGSGLQLKKGSTIMNQGNTGGSVLGSLATVGEDEEMQKIKAEFVEYVKEILTKTTSQVASATGQGGPGGNKQRSQKLSQMNMIEEVTYFLREGRENRQKVISNISIPELLKQTTKKEGHNNSSL